MAVDEIAQLGVSDGGQVVGLEFALKATLELQQRTVLDVKQSNGTQRCSGLCQLATMPATQPAIESTRERKRSKTGPLAVARE